MRALSANMTENQLFLASPMFVSDLLYISEALKSVEIDKRTDYLKDTLEEINKFLPANVYVPITQERTNRSKNKRKDMKRK
jgi:hypothetical protein